MPGGGFFYELFNTPDTYLTKASNERVLEWLDREAAAHGWDAWDWQRYIGEEASNLSPVATSPYDMQGYSTNNRNFWQYLRDVWSTVGECLFFDFETHPPFGTLRTYNHDVDDYGVYGKLDRQDAMDCLFVTTGNGVSFFDGGAGIGKTLTKTIRFPEWKYTFSQVELDGYVSQAIDEFNAAAWTVTPVNIFSSTSLAFGHSEGVQVSAVSRYIPSTFSSLARRELVISISESYYVAFKWVGERNLRSCVGFSPGMTPSLLFRLTNTTSSGSNVTFSDFGGDCLPSLVYGFLPADLTNQWRYLSGSLQFGIDYDSNTTTIAQAILDSVLAEEYSEIFRDQLADLPAVGGGTDDKDVDCENMFLEEPDEEGIIYWVWGPITRFEQPTLDVALLNVGNPVIGPSSYGGSVYHSSLFNMEALLSAGGDIRTDLFYVNNRNTSHLSHYRGAVELPTYV